VVLATTDGGITWRQQNNADHDDLRAMFFVTPSIGWAVGSSGTILATTDGGANWRNRDSGTPDDLNGIYFDDATNGWAVGANGTILTTTDGGITWASHDSGTPFDLHAVRFADARRGWAVGANGTLLITVDGGATWQPRDTGGTTPFLGLTSGRPAGPGERTNLWATGSDGSIVRISAPDITAIAHAEHLPDMLAALRSSDIAADLIGQPLTDFGSADADMAQRSAAIAGKPVSAPVAAPEPGPVAAPAPVPVTHQPVSDPSGLFHDPLALATMTRAGILAYLLIAGLILGTIIRWAHRQTAHIDACADALIMSAGASHERFMELVRILSPAGRIPRELQVRRETLAERAKGPGRKPAFDPAVSLNRRL
jgi:hypothetical protein